MVKLLMKKLILNIFHNTQKLLQVRMNFEKVRLCGIKIKIHR